MDGGTHRMKLMAAFSNFSNAPKNPQYLSCKFYAISIIYKTGYYGYLSPILIMKIKPSNTHNENVMKDVLSVWGR